MDWQTETFIRVTANRVLKSLYDRKMPASACVQFVRELEKNPQTAHLVSKHGGFIPVFRLLMRATKRGRGQLLLTMLRFIPAPA